MPRLSRMLTSLMRMKKLGNRPSTISTLSMIKSMKRISHQQYRSYPGEETVQGRSSRKSQPWERVTSWFTHFKNLLGSPPEVDDPDKDIPKIFEDLDIKDDKFTFEEFKKVKSSIKIRKAAGPDEISPDVYKSCDFDEICLDFSNHALMENDKPDIWSYMNIIPVSKSGDLSNTNNYRGISLVCILASSS